MVWRIGRNKKKQIRKISAFNLISRKSPAYFSKENFEFRASSDIRSGPDSASFLRECKSRLILHMDRRRIAIRNSGVALVSSSPFKGSESPPTTLHLPHFYREPYRGGGKKAGKLNSKCEMQTAHSKKIIRVFFIRQTAFVQLATESDIKSSISPPPPRFL